MNQTRVFMLLGMVVLFLILFFIRNNPLRYAKQTKIETWTLKAADELENHHRINKSIAKSTNIENENDTTGKMFQTTALNENFVKSQLLEGQVPPNVHYIWCGKRWFEFKHYLSFVSIIKSIKPNIIVLHYDIEPQVDQNLYNLWLEDLKHDYPYLKFEKMKDKLTDFCNMDRESQIHSILTLLNSEGGVYISENTWLLDVPPEERLIDFKMALEPHSLDGYIFMKSNIYNGLNLHYQDLLKNTKLKSIMTSCQPVHQVENSETFNHCYIVKGGRFNRFWPMDIWDSEDRFGALCRKIFYGGETILKPKPSYDTLVPNIGHMVWIGGGPMDFVFYLSVLSMLFVAKVDVVYIHGDQPPNGAYWQKLNSIERIRSRIKCIERTPPSIVYQGIIEPYYRALMSDIIRVDLMIKYGGLYTDTDAIWVKPLTYEERGYEAVACFDWVDWSYPYPDSVNFGVSYGKRNAPFWRLFRDSMRVLHNDLHGFTGVMNPYRLLEKHPNLLQIDKRLSVICYYSRCHPIWVKDYHNMTNDHVTTNSIPNWREDVHAFHWTHPNPVEYGNETILLKSTGLFAEIGKNVLRNAGLL